jgi:hypothetical protein
VYGSVQNRNTHKNKAPLLGTILSIRKVEGVLTENYLRIRIISFLKRIIIILRYRLQMSKDPDLLFSSLRIRITITVSTQF